MDWLTLIVSITVVLWILLEDATDETTPKVMVECWLIVCIVLPILLIASLIMVASGNPTITKIGTLIYATITLATLVLRLILLAIRSVIKLYASQFN